MATQPILSQQTSRFDSIECAEAGEVYFTEEEIVGWTGTQAQIGGANSSDNWFLSETPALCSHLLKSL